MKIIAKEYFGGFLCKVTFVKASASSHYCRYVEHKYDKVNLNRQKPGLSYSIQLICYFQ